jgi:hypothetical protein
VTLVPALLLLVLQVMFSGSTTFIRTNAFLFPAITLFSVIQVFVSAFAMLALSSLSKSSRFVGVMFAGIMFFTAAMYQVLRAMTGSASWAWISPWESLAVIANAIFRVKSGYAVPVPIALSSVVAIVVIAVVILERRVRGVEVVT